VERKQATVPVADEANVERVLDDMAARTELHSIETLTLSDTQFLRGDANEKASLGAQPAAMQPRYQSTRNCKIREEADGLLINTDTKLPFAYTDACVVHGVHIGHESPPGTPNKRLRNSSKRCSSSHDRVTTGCRLVALNSRADHQAPCVRLVRYRANSQIQSTVDAPRQLQCSMACATDVVWRGDIVTFLSRAR
jgi:hypothetical protein